MLGGLIDPIRPKDILRLDPIFVATVMAVLILGLVMVASASTFTSNDNFGYPSYYLTRQLLYLVIGLVFGAFLLNVPTEQLKEHSILLMLLALVLLILVLIPGIGKSVNGSQRWISLGVFNLQPSEAAKVAMVLYVSGFLVRRSARVRQNLFIGSFMPIGFTFIFLVLLMKEPDFGASVVLLGTVIALLFIAGAPLKHFLWTIAAAGGALAVLAVSSEYRMKRLMNFWDPWQDPFNDGYQLSQALIAFGRGEWFGLGLGNSVQKLAYLPEAHTDFVFSVWVEETGLFGGILLLLVFGLLVARMFIIGQRAIAAHKIFQAYICYGFAILLIAQVIINIGVNTGVLPTKGLTLPLISYGGSSLIIMLGSLFIVARVDIETKRAVGLESSLVESEPELVDDELPFEEESAEGVVEVRGG